MKNTAVSFVMMTALLLVSCTTQPKNQTVTEPETPAIPVEITEPEEPKTEAVTTPEIVPEPEEDIVAQFENVTITKQTFITTKTELEAVVNDLNRITFSRDYNSWLGYLSPEYLATFSDPEVLADVSANLPIKGVQLRTIKEYFNYVFVPSRQNMRVDDIKFVSPTRVYVIMEISPGNPAAIYIIEKFGDTWKLVPKNQ